MGNCRVLKPLSYGINTYDLGRGVNTTHAEANAIMKLPPRPKKKNLKKIDILVIRTSSLGKIGISKPCIKCLIDMSVLPQKRGYIIKNVLYSDSNGEIVQTTLKKLLESGDYHMSRFYKERNFQPNIQNLISNLS